MTEIEKLAAQIPELEKRSNALREKCEKLASEASTATINALAAWIPEAARAEIARNPEAAQKIGPDNVRALKETLKSYTLSELPMLVRDAMTVPKFWPHQDGYVPSHSNARSFGPGEFRVYDRNEYTLAPERVRRAIQPVLDGFAARWKKHGLPLGHGTREQGWPGSFYVPTGMAATFNAYAEAAAEFVKVDDELNAVRRKKAALEATKMWDDN